MKSGQKQTKFENILEKGSLLHAIITRNKLLDYLITDDININPLMSGEKPTKGEKQKGVRDVNFLNGAFLCLIFFMF